MYAHGMPGFVKYFAFDYKPEYVVPLLNRKIDIVWELYVVTFDAEGKAVFLERLLSIHGSSKSGTTTWDLKTRNEIPFASTGRFRGDRR